MPEDEKPSYKVGDYADKDGQFRRPDSVFRSVVSSEPNSQFKPEAGRYVLYINYGCPWAHRTVITRSLKGLEDIVPLIEVGDKVQGKGWAFGGKTGPDKDPLYGGKYLRDLYEKANPSHSGPVTVPMLWDKKHGSVFVEKKKFQNELTQALETIVNNESSEIIRMFYSGFDELLPESQRESAKGETGLLPTHLRPEIEAMNDWVYNTINNGVYKCGFAATQAAYEANVFPLFESLDRLEKHLASSSHQPYLFGSHITEADIRLYTTAIRFDIAYNPIFKCNLKMIRHDYPNLHNWLRNLYWKGPAVFQESVRFEEYKKGYAGAIGAKIYPAGPLPLIMPFEQET